MRANLILLVTIIGLFLGLSLLMQAIYGQSYGFLSGEDSWVPDGHGGWAKHGNPSSPPPEKPSVEVPLIAHYLPIIVPGLLLAAFLFTPLGRKLEERRPESQPTPPLPDSNEPPENPDTTA